METYAVKNVTKLRPEAPQSSDVLTEILRSGAQALLQQAVEAELQAYLSRVNSLDRPPAAILNGYSPERAIQTGIKPLPPERTRRVRSTYRLELCTLCLATLAFCHGILM